MNIDKKSKLIVFFSFIICVGGLATNLIPVRAQAPTIKNYILVGTDSISNIDQGDTSNNEKHGLLCIFKPSGGLPQPIGVGGSPPGSTTDQWSGGYMFVIPNVQGRQLISRQIADTRCSIYGRNNFNYPKARMAEFHDGGQSATNNPTSFWGDVTFLSASDPYFSNPRFAYFDDRLWIAIRDRNTNPWGQYNQSSNRPRLALTFGRLRRIYCAIYPPGSGGNQVACAGK
jgi:hypothetical protein